MKRKISLTIIIFLIFIISIVLMYPKKNNKILNATIDSKNSMLSIMVESEAGTGNYKDASSFPSTGYYLNKKLSKCVNGSKISFSDGSLSIKGNKTDRCYAYFDKDELGSICKGQNMAECFVQNYQKDETIIYHDGKPDNVKEENYELEAGDLSYRYSGASADVNNYICFGNDTCSSDSTKEDYNYLYRIIGLFKNSEGQYETKIIKADYSSVEVLGDGGEYQFLYNQPNNNYLGDKSNYFSTIAGYSWNSKTKNNNWAESELNTINLNDYFVNQFIGKGQNIKTNPNKWQQMISEHRWIVGGNTDAKIGNSKVKDVFENEIIKPQYDLYYDAYIGLPYVSDYGYATISSNWSEYILNAYSNIKLTDWIYMGLFEYTLTPWNNNASSGIFHINYMGHLGWVSSYIIRDGYEWGIAAVRPCLYLNSSIKLLSGDGTKENPYLLSVE